ncbi:pimeloyl-ACP methyl ester carboxylesterase [Nocardiopsis mwathae]|uniref:Pimeloyl-ACP methyl ester carboxylesterase n=1 Tax=Nocardiopsis mwathae TaxID=1472723 RepID=A0A7W9YM09_9ACTN|nr:alpha/beta hydrolase [Nocardiopsis mwathae]MBB6174638.1 pimeloyl-ACP methyl ester carboxylesterase [Nocardiopsis mwathae]
MARARLHDGSRIEFEVSGTGPAVLLPVDPRPAEEEKADELRTWGVDPALGRSLVDGLTGAFRVVAFDYEGHVMAHPKPDTLTPKAVAADILAVADAAGADRFAYYGYSWLALSGLQLALRTDRLTALAMGGFPPLDGPYAEMLRVTTATHAMTTGEAATAAGGDDRPTDVPEAEPGAEWGESADSGEFDWDSVDVTMSASQTRQFVTLYEALASFDDRAAQQEVGCPRLCFAGTADTIRYGPRWGDVVVDIAGILTATRPELRSLGWEVHLLDGLDHTAAMQPDQVLPILRPWLEANATV